MTLMHDITGSYLRHANLRHATPTSPAPMFPFLFLAISYSITNCLYTLIRRKNLRQHSNRSSTLASSPSYINWVRSPVGLRNERHRIRISWLFRCRYVSPCPSLPDSLSFIFLSSGVSSSFPFFTISLLGRLRNAQTWAPHYSSARFVYI